MEFALVVPLLLTLLTLLFGIFWLGRAYNVYETITRAARERARYAALPSSMFDGNTFPDTLSSTCATNTNAFNIQTQVQMRLENQPVVSGGSPTCP